MPLPDSVTDPLIGLAAAIGAVLVIWRFVVPAVRKLRYTGRRAGRALDVVLGTPAIPDPDRPGEFLRPAVPDMGVRMTAVEEAMVSIVARATERAQAAAEASAIAAEEARKAAAHAARDARLSRKEVALLHAAAEVWHVDEIDVLRNLEHTHTTPTIEDSEE